MLSKQELKFISSLALKKNRAAEKLFITEGEKSVSEGLKSNLLCKLIIATNSFAETHRNILNAAAKKNIRTEIIRNSEFEKIAGTVSPQGILALFKIPEYSTADLYADKIIVALENISDPGNLGTIIRTCDWFGINKILLNENCADLYNPKVIRSTMGSVFHVSAAEVSDFYLALQNSRKNGFDILTAHMEGKNIFEYKPTNKIILCFCNEAKGPTEELKNITDKFLHIPSIGLAESLNVASAAAIIISNVTRFN